MKLYVGEHLLSPEPSISVRESCRIQPVLNYCRGQVGENLINISVALWVVRQNFGIFLRDLEILGHLYSWKTNQSQSRWDEKELDNFGGEHRKAFLGTPM